MSKERDRKRRENKEQHLTKNNQNRVSQFIINTKQFLTSTLGILFIVTSGKIRHQAIEISKHIIKQCEEIRRQLNKCVSQVILSNVDQSRVSTESTICTNVRKVLTNRFSL